MPIATGWLGIMKNTSLYALGVFVIVSGTQLTGSQPSSPEAQTDSPRMARRGQDEGSETLLPKPEPTGFGAATKGATSSSTGFQTIRVTSLADDGPGSLRRALSRGKRYIRFDVGGTITLDRDLNIRFSYITIDGSTAPPPGITIVQPGNIGTTIEARRSTGPVHDVVIQSLRMNGLGGGSTTNVGDIWGLDGMDAPVHHIVLHRITGIAATDGVFDIYGAVHDVTLSWNLIMDTQGALHVSTTDITQRRERISVHHNVFAGNNERQIRVRHDSRMLDYVNNVVYGWGSHEAGGSGLHIAYDPGEINPSLNVVSNVFHFVTGPRALPDEAIKFERGPDVGSVFFKGNLVPTGESDNVSTGKRLAIPRVAQVAAFEATTLKDLVVPYVGTHYPTGTEIRLLAQIRSDLGRTSSAVKAPTPATRN